MQKDVRYPFVANFKNLLYANIANPDFRIAEHIKALGYSSDYFRRCFKDEVGKTPQQYLTDMRITEAKSLLCGMSFKGVYDVALRCGFSDSFYFTKVFKAHTGVSPRDYRKLNFN